MLGRERDWPSSDPEPWWARARPGLARLWGGLMALLLAASGLADAAAGQTDAGGQPAAPCATRPSHQWWAVGAPSRPMALVAYPRPANDSGRGVHWVPTAGQTPAVVDRFIAEARAMRISWITFLNDGTTIGPNDYLVQQAVAHDIEPIMRIYTPRGRPIEGRLLALVRHYRQRGVRYFQLYNEPNTGGENVDGAPDVDRYVTQWSEAARVVLIGGGLPGLGALSPGGDHDDLAFLDGILVRLIERGQIHLLDCAWLALHNYLFNRPVDYVGDQHSYLGFRLYHAIVERRLGRPLPMIGTEGGTHVGVAFDPAYPPVDANRQVELVIDAYRYLARPDREAYYFAGSYWLIANELGGSTEPAWSGHALFQPAATSAIVERLKQRGAGG